VTSSRLLTVLLAAALAFAAACGSGEEAAAPKEETSPEAELAAAATKTTDAGSYRAEFTLTMDGAIPGSPGRRVAMNGEGVFDTKAQSGHMTFDMSEFARAVGARDFGDIELVMERFVMYMKFPLLQELQPGMKPWIRFDLRKIAAQQGLGLAGLDQLNQSDPRQALLYLRAASGRVDEVGEEEVRDVSTTHYRMTVDLEKVAKLNPEQRENVERVIEQSGVRTVPTEVWLDDDGLVRRMKLAYDDMQFAAGQRGDMAMTMELYDFGTAVDVEPPPAGQVIDIEKLTRATR
jgi:hypothetical protein